MYRLAYLILSGFFFGVLSEVPLAYGEGVPQAAYKYRSELIRSTRVVWGLNAPVATFAAQIHQESTWRPTVRSRAGAEGIAQFMPATAEWMKKMHPEALGNGNSLNPAWGILAMAHYNYWHYERLTARNKCEHWAMVLSAYNGGLGWVRKDIVVASAAGSDGQIWFGSVERFNSGRSTGHFRENRNYVKNILMRLEPLYVSAGWGFGVCGALN